VLFELSLTDYLMENLIECELIQEEENDSDSDSDEK